MNRDHLFRFGMVAVLLLGLAWLFNATEWVSEQVDGKPTGEALTNNLYATQSVLRVLGVKVIHTETMQQLPPPQATLVLVSTHWDFLPDSLVRLHQWVEGGGHLVITSGMAGQDKVKSWVQVSQVAATKNTNKSLPQKPVAAPRWATGELLNTEKCHDVVETRGASIPSLPERKFQICSPGPPVLTSLQEPLWQLDGPYGHEVLRVAVGQGAVTVMSMKILYDRDVLKADHAAMAVAALRAQPAGEVWFVVNEKRAPLLSWLWTTAWPAVLLGLLALGVALWRNGARFGPREADRAVGRRSVAEQVRGTAQFLRTKGMGALHQAQARALEEMAVRHIPDFRTMDTTARAQAIGQFANLNSSPLSRALDIRLRRTPQNLHAILQLLELARRRIRERAVRARIVPLPPHFVDPDQKEDHAN